MTSEDDFTAFVVARQRALRRSAALLTGDPALAHDLVQTALIKAWPRWRQVAASGGQEAYARRIMVTTHLSWRRRSWRKESPSEALPDIGAVASDADLAHCVRQALLSLPRRQRAAVVLRYFDDLTEQQTADALGCSVGTVKSQTSRALQKLRAHPALADVWHEEAAR